MLYHQCHTVLHYHLLPPMSHRVTLSLNTTNVTPCYTINLLPPMSHRVTLYHLLPPMSHRVTLYHLPTISGGWGGPPVPAGWPAWGVLPPCLWWTGCPLAVCNAHAVPPTRAVALPCCGSMGVWGCRDVNVCVRVWVCVWEGCESVSRTNVKLTYWVQTKLRWYHCTCLSTSGFKNVKSSQSESRIQKLCNLIGWHILSETWNSQNLELKQWLSSPIEWINYFYKHFLSN